MSINKNLTRDEAILKLIKKGRTASVVNAIILLSLAGLQDGLSFYFLFKNDNPQEGNFMSTKTYSDYGLFLIFLFSSVCLTYLAIRNITSYSRLKTGMKNDPNFKVYPGLKGAVEFHFKTDKMVRITTLWYNHWFTTYFDRREDENYNK